MPPRVPAPVVEVHKHYLLDGEDFMYVAISLAVALPILAGLGALVVIAWRYALSPHGVG